MYSQFKIEKTALVVYYINKKKKVRFYTGIRADEWNTSKGQLKPTIENYEQKREALNILKERVDKFIQEYKAKGASNIPAEELKRLVEKNKEVQTTKLSTDVIGSYTTFLQEKIINFSNKGKPQSAKDYISLHNALQDYNRAKDTTLYIKDLDKTFFTNFVTFLKNDRPAPKGKFLYHAVSNNESAIHSTFEQKPYITLKQGQKTIKKRFDCLTTFMSLLRRTELITEAQIYDIKSFKSKDNMPVPATEKTHLTREEIYLLHSHACSNKEEENIKDLFVFACLTGVRFSDLMRIEKSDIKTLKGLTVLAMDAQKTSEPFAVPLIKLALEILEKHNFNFNKSINKNNSPNYNQLANRILKKVLRDTKLFTEETKKTDKDTGRTLREEEILSFHRGRDTFINNLIETTPLSILMSYTGHKKIDTLQKYLKVEGSPINYVSSLEVINKEAELTKEAIQERKLYEKLKAKFDKQY
jgi:integrase